MQKEEKKNPVRKKETQKKKKKKEANYIVPINALYKIIWFFKNTLITPYTISAINGHPRPPPPPHQVCRKCSLCKANQCKERKGKKEGRGGVKEISNMSV